MSAIPVPDPEQRRKRVILTGDVPSPMNPPTGCRFHPRCPLRPQLGDPAICAAETPALLDLGGGHSCACHFRTPADHDGPSVPIPGLEPAPQAAAAPTAPADTASPATRAPATPVPPASPRPA